MENYETLDGRYGGLYSKSAARLCSFASIAPGQTVVDLGCGTGHLSVAIDRLLAGSGRIVGVDLSGAMLQRARERFEGRESVVFVERDMEEIGRVCHEFSLAGKVDAVLSSFAFFYVADKFESLQREILGILRPGGVWSFNITRYFLPIAHAGEVRNRFAEIFLDTLNGVLKDRGTSGVEVTPYRTDPYLKMLSELGFSNVRSELWPLPLSPGEAYELTIEGFYRFGLTTVFAESLMELPLPERTELLRSALGSCRERLEATGERPHVVNVSACAPG